MGHSRPLFMFYATELWRYPKHDTMFALNTWYNFFLNDRPKLVKLVSSVPVKPIKAIFFGQQITSQSSDQRVGSRTGDRRKRFHTFQISRHFCSTVFCREMEYIERASCNTFYTFQNKHKSISIYRILRCCVLKKNQNVVKVMKLASPTRDQQISIKDAHSIYSTSLVFVRRNLKLEFELRPRQEQFIISDLLLDYQSRHVQSVTTKRPNKQTMKKCLLPGSERCHNFQVHILKQHFIVLLLIEQAGLCHICWLESNSSWDHSGSDNHQSVLHCYGD